MVHGKKGFERIKNGFERVLDSSLSWLVYIPSPKPTENAETSAPEPDFSATGPFARYAPMPRRSSPEITMSPSIQTPSLDQALTNLDTSASTFQEDAVELLEWLGLVTMESPRVSSSDDIDPFLCRYSVPNSNLSKATTIVKIAWKGFLPAPWIRCIFVECCIALKAVPGSWFSLSSHAFNTEAVDGQSGFTILRLPPKSITDSAGLEINVGSKDGDSGKRKLLPADYVLWQMSRGSGMG
ncbi:hypothetical protein MMC25_005128 [Agyrium rufum]|nr:hypothetical protein [Agyrium rufum]